ncbi:MAG: type II toxin-antitoxin system prevent-host-death family antitoxin [Mycobacteriales bacterium]
MDQIGVRELRQHASRWLERVRRGESFEVTDRGRPVAMLVPFADDSWDRLVAAGLASEPVDGDSDITRLRLARGARVTSALQRLRDDER